MLVAIAPAAPFTPLEANASVAFLPKPAPIFIPAAFNPVSTPSLNASVKYSSSSKALRVCSPTSGNNPPKANPVLAPTIAPPTALPINIFATEPPTSPKNCPPLVSQPLASLYFCMLLRVLDLSSNMLLNTSTGLNESRNVLLPSTNPLPILSSIVSLAFLAKSF